MSSAPAQSFRRHCATRLPSKCSKSRALSSSTIDYGDATAGPPPIASARASIVIDALQVVLPDDIVSLVLDCGVKQDYIAFAQTIDGWARLMMYDPLADRWSTDEEIPDVLWTGLVLYQGRLATWKFINGTLRFSVRNWANSWQTCHHRFKGTHDGIDTCFSIDGQSLLALCLCHSHLYALQCDPSVSDDEWEERAVLSRCKLDHPIVLVTADRCYIHQVRIGELHWYSIATGTLGAGGHHDMNEGAAVVQLDADRLLMAGGLRFHNPTGTLFKTAACRILSLTVDAAATFSSAVKAAASMNFARSSHCLVKAEGNVYAIGGAGSRAGQAIEMYDVLADRWVIKSDPFPPSARAEDLSRQRSRQGFNVRLARMAFKPSDVCVITS